MDEAYLARLNVLRQQRNAISERTAANARSSGSRALGESLEAADVGKEKADLA